MSDTPATPATPALDPAAELKRLRAIEQAAMPEPWAVFERHGRDAGDEGWSECVIRPAEGGAAIALTYLTDVIETDDDGANERFIIEARTAFPRLLAAVEAVLNLAGEAGEVGSDTLMTGAWNLDPDALREAITSALTGKEGS